jgi:hypothetical protein
VGSTWRVVPVRRLLQGLHGPLPMSGAWSYPVTPLAAFALSGAFDKWDAINAPYLSQPVQACHPCQRMPAWTPWGGRLLVVACSTFGPHAIGTQRFRAVCSGASFAQVAGAILWIQAWVQSADREELRGCAPHELPCPRWLPQGPPRVRAGDRRAGGGQTPVRAADRRGHQPGHRTSLAMCAGHQPSGRRSFRKQRTVNPLMVPARYNFLYSPQAAPAGGRLRRPSSPARTGAHG